MPCIVKYQGKYLQSNRINGFPTIKYVEDKSQATELSSLDYAITFCFMVDVPGSIIDSDTGEILMNEGNHE